MAGGLELLAYVCECLCQEAVPVPGGLPMHVAEVWSSSCPPLGVGMPVPVCVLVWACACISVGVGELVPVCAVHVGDAGECGAGRGGGGLRCGPACWREAHRL